MSVRFCVWVAQAIRLG